MVLEKWRREDDLSTYRYQTCIGHERDPSPQYLSLFSFHKFINHLFKLVHPQGITIFFVLLFPSSSSLILQFTLKSIPASPKKLYGMKLQAPRPFLIAINREKVDPLHGLFLFHQFLILFSGRVSFSMRLELDPPPPALQLQV